MESTTKPPPTVDPGVPLTDGVMFEPLTNFPFEERRTFRSLEIRREVGDMKKGWQKTKPDHFTEDDMNNFDLKSFIKKHLLAGCKQMDYKIKDLFIILKRAKDVFETCETLIDLDGPVNVCGDIHGQYSDLFRIFNVCGMPFQSKFLFLGDYVDRGRHSIEVIVLLLCCRIQFPAKVHLLRGNHELQHINKLYGFWEECEERFRDTGDAKALYDEFNEVFALMPLAALISNRILCMHGGLSPELKTLDDIRKIRRPLHTVKGLAQDLLWSDPDASVSGFQTNKSRSVSHTFGEDVVIEKCKELKLDLIIRAHQVVEFGYSFFANKLLITVFSAARYHDGLINYAAIVQCAKHFTYLVLSAYLLSTSGYTSCWHSEKDTFLSFT